MGISTKLRARAKVAAKRQAANAAIRPKLVNNARKVDAEGVTPKAIQEPVLVAKPRDSKSSLPPPAARPLPKRMDRLTATLMQTHADQDLIALTWLQPSSARPRVPQQRSIEPVPVTLKNASWTRKGRARALTVAKLVRKPKPSQKLPKLPHGYGNIKALHSLLNLSDSCSNDINHPCSHFPQPADALIASIDTETERHGLKDHIVEIGLTILDTRSIYAANPGPFAHAWLAKTKTYHYVLDKTRRPVNRMRSCFFAPDYFGSAADVRRLLLNKLTKHFHGQGQGAAHRKLILVGHGLASDLNLLRRCPDMQLDISTNLTPEIPISMVFDTATLAHEAKIAGAEVPAKRLGNLVNWLGVHPQFRRGSSVIGWHNAGNDAAYTMMALLMLAVNWGHVVRPGYGVKSGYEVMRDVPVEEKVSVSTPERWASKATDESAATSRKRTRLQMGWWGRLALAARRSVFGR